MGGRFVLSDDAHAVAQVGLNYHKVKDFVKSVGIREIHYVTREHVTEGNASFASRSFDDLEFHPAW